MNPFVSELLTIVKNALIILMIQLIFIVLGTRFGWFVWVLKRIISFKRTKADDK